VTREPYAVERCWHGVAPDGTEHAVVFRVGVPRPHEQGDWTADVAIIPMQPTSYAIIGVDSWQAVELGMHHIAVMTKHYYERGWRFYWERGGEEAMPGELQRKSE
jgi:hypothetical protein